MKKLLIAALALGALSTGAHSGEVHHYDFNYTTPQHAIKLDCWDDTDLSRPMPYGRKENRCTYQEWGRDKKGRKTALKQTIKNGSWETGQGTCGGYTIWEFVSGNQKIVMSLDPCETPGNGGSDDPAGLYDRYVNGKRVEHAIMY